MEIEEFEKLYSDVDLTFSGYYKYEFTFIGTAPDGTKIYDDYGGNADDIYRHSVGSGEVRKVGNVRSSWHRVTATKGDDAVFEYSDW